MSRSVLCASLWVLAATVTALLPMRRQYVPGVILLVLAPLLILWLGADFGWGWGVVAVLAFASMFRRPLRYFYVRARGERPELAR